jgi:phosphohistidine phosphatase SixA
MNRIVSVLLALALASVAFAHESPKLTTVILVRHAEKVTTDPNAKDPALTAAGEERAQRLARMLADADVTAIFTTPFIRTRSTAAPLATLKKVTPVEVPTGPTFAAEMAKRIHALAGGTIVVVGHTNSTQDLMKALGVTNAPKIEESEYDNLFIVALGPDEPVLVRLRY